MSNKMIRYNARKLREMRDKCLTSPIHAAQTTGNRVPTVLELMTYFALYRGVAMDSREIGIRLNCPPGNVLAVLVQLEHDGTIRPQPCDGERTESTKWVF